MIDIHSHILPKIDDGSKSVEESLKLLEEMKSQGITDVFATPHFYPQFDNTYDFKKNLNESYNSLINSINDSSLPNIHLGCELLYYQGIGVSNSLSQFCLSNSNYLLLELIDQIIDKNLFNDLILLKKQNIIPIIVHIERYFGAKNFSKFLRFVKRKEIMTQINASSVLDNDSYKTVKKLIKKNIVTFIATDTHSIEKRPPYLKDALNILSKDFGKEYTEKLINNSSVLFEKIKGETQ